MGRHTQIPAKPRGAAAGTEPAPKITNAEVRAPGRLARRRRTLQIAVIGAALFLVYLSNVRVLSSGDNIPTRLLPFSILREGNLDLDEFPRLHARAGRTLYYVHERDGHLYSGSPILTSLAVTPLYVLPAWWLSASQVPYDDVRAQLVFVIMERLVAAALTAVSAALLCVVLQRLVPWRWAVGITLIYALGTTTWRFSGQGLYSHVLSELAVVILAAIFVHRDPDDTPSRAAFVLAGATAAIAVGGRPQMLGIVVLTALFVWNHYRRHMLAFALIPLIGGVLVAAYNLSIFRSLAGAYGGFNHFSNPILSGLVGLLFSPNRGLFIFTPIVVFAVWGAIQVWRTPAAPWLRYMTIAVVLHVVLYSTFDEWWGGYAIGPRYFTDIVPLLCLYLAYGLAPAFHSRALAALCVVLAAYGVAVQAIGVYFDDDSWNLTPVPLEQRPERVWDWFDLHLVRALRSGWHGGELIPLCVSAFRDPVPARLAALTESDLAAGLAVSGPPARLRHGASQRTTVLVSNHGPRTWPVFAADYYVRDLAVLVVRWLADGQPIPRVGDVVELPKNVCPGETVEVPVWLTAPAACGQYEVEMRVVQALDGTSGVTSPNPFRFPVAVD